MAVRGCGSGLPGKNDRGLDLYGLLAFIQLQQCSQDRCNAKLNLTSRGLNPAGRWGRGPRPGAGPPLGGVAGGRHQLEAGDLRTGWGRGHALGRGREAECPSRGEDRAEGTPELCFLSTVDPSLAPRSPRRQ